MAACIGAMVATSITYPLDTKKVAAQLNVRGLNLTPRLYAGWKVDIGSTCAATFVFFETYERLKVILPVPIASFAGICFSSCILSPFDNLKKIRQVKINYIVENPIINSKSMWANFALTVSKNAPKASIKYAIYEPLVRTLRLYSISSGMAGALAALISCMISSVLFLPLDTVKTYVALSKTLPTDIGAYFNGIRASISLSLLNNLIGHSLLEHLSSA